MDYLTLPNIELATVGMSWKAKYGDITITFEHLADAVEAGNNDPHVKAARVKLGHVDTRFNDEAVPDHDPFYVGEGEPAFGKASNLRLANEGAVLVGDLINVPDWLAQAAFSAYPSRSIEGAWSPEAGLDVTTAGGKHYSFVLTAVALLGIYLPAVADLEDLEQLLTEGVELVKDNDVIKAKVAAAAMGAPVDASADVDKVIQLFWSEVAIDDQYWWWPRAVWTDPNEIIADDDEGGLYRIPFASDAKGNVSFEDPIEVRQLYVDLSTGAPVATSERDSRPAKVFASAEAGRNQAGRPSTKEQVAMTIDTDALRKRLGLPEDASEEQINEALAEEPVTPDPDDTNENEIDDAAVVEEPEPVAASTEPTITVDRTAFEALQAQAAEGAAARAEQLTERREGILVDAVKAGKITPASKDAWRQKLVSASEATEAELEGLPKGLIPVDEQGVAAAATGSDETHSKLMRDVYGVEVSGKD